MLFELEEAEVSWYWVCVLFMRVSIGRITYGRENYLYMQECKTWMNIGNIHDMDGADYETIRQSYEEALQRARKLQNMRLQVTLLFGRFPFCHQVVALHFVLPTSNEASYFSGPSAIINILPFFNILND